MIALKINVKKIDKSHLFPGAKGTYLDCLLVEKASEYDDGFIAQSVSKEQKDQGIKGPIIGSWRELDKKTTPPPRQPPIPQRPAPNPQHDLIADDDIPF